MAKIKPHDRNTFYRLFGRWSYTQHRKPDGKVDYLPAARAGGWYANVPQDFVDYLKANGCGLDESPD